MQAPTQDASFQRPAKGYGNTLTRRGPEHALPGGQHGAQASPEPESDKPPLDPASSPSYGHDSEEHGVLRNGEAHTHPSQGNASTAERIIYFPGEVMLDQKKLPTFKPLAFLAVFLYVATVTSRQQDYLESSSTALLRLTELEVVIVTWLFVVIGTGCEAIVSRPALTVHKLSWLDFAKLLPWSASFLTFTVLTGIVHLSLYNGYIAASYAVLPAFGAATFIALFGSRYSRTGPLFITAFVTIVLLFWVCLGRRFPNIYLPVHVLLWALSFGLYCKLTPTPPPSASVTDDERNVDTYGFVMAVNTTVLALAALIFVLPNFFPIPLSDLFAHIVKGHIWWYILSLWSLARFHTSLLSFQFKSSPEATVGAIGLAAAVVFTIAHVCNILPAPIAPVANMTARFKLESTLFFAFIASLTVFLSIVQRNVRDLFQFDMYATLDPVRFPYHVLHLLSITDSIRLSIATFIWTLLRICAYPLSAVIAPAGAGYFMAPHPIPSGNNIVPGVCVLVAPYDTMDKHGTQPGYFVFNAGNIAGKNRGGDWLSTAGTTAQITRQFAADPDAGGPGTGFCGNVVMEFAQYDKPTTFKPYGSLFPTSHRQFNLSGWKDAEAAGEWYMKNGPHKHVVKQYHNESGTKPLQTFQAMLCSLQPARRIVYQNRCTQCHVMVSDYPNVDTCPTCNIPLPPMPLF